MVSARGMKSPMPFTTHLIKFDGISLDDLVLYRLIVRSLQYAIVTHPEIAFSVNKVCQYMSSPTDQHWKAVKRILRYLSNCSSKGLKLQKTNGFQLRCFSDAVWGRTWMIGVQLLRFISFLDQI